MKGLVNRLNGPEEILNSCGIKSLECSRFQRSVGRAYSRVTRVSHTTNCPIYLILTFRHPPQ